MPAELGPPPRVSQRRHKYKEFFRLLITNPGQWASLPLDEVGGATPNAKQTNLWSCAKQFGMRIQTTVQEGKVFARVIREA